jgi:hypothetical protein
MCDQLDSDHVPLCPIIFPEKDVLCGNWLTQAMQKSLSCVQKLRGRTKQLAELDGSSYFRSLIERYVVCVLFVCWLRIAFVPLSVVLGALGSLRLLSILTIHSVCYPRAYQL